MHEIKICHELLMNPVLFHSAEKTYDDELKWLKRKINEQLAIRNDGLVV